MDDQSPARRLPSVDLVLRTKTAQDASARFGRAALVDTIRAVLDDVRTAAAGGDVLIPEANAVAEQSASRLERETRPKVRPVFNLTGTILHTNLGRAVLAEAAIEAAAKAMRQAIALEFDLNTGKRGERDSLVRELLCALTGAEDATVVNNNAAAVLIVLNTLANRREAIVSRGELIEIGGAFRMPAIMARAGTKLVEVGTTNRTHARDYIEAIGLKTGLVLKVHTSNYRIEGFTKEVSGRELAAIASERGVPLVNDLGSGTLVDVSPYGLAHEPTVAEAVAEGADLVTFSGDKLLGGPQTGFIVGKRDLIARINRNPMKRALRVDKLRLAALEATLNLYRNPERLAERLPTLRHMARPKPEIEALAKRLLPPLAEAVGADFSVTIVDCDSQVGSGSLPQQTIASAGLAVRPVKKSGRALDTLAAKLRALPIPIIGRIADGSLILDLRCLDDEAAFVEELSAYGPTN